MAGGSSSRSSKGKSKMVGPPPPPRRVEMFQFNISTLLPPTLPEEVEAAPRGTWGEVISGIHGGIVQLSQAERVHPEDAEVLGPSEYSGKTVLPRCNKLFVVRVTNTRGQTVVYLFEWNTLYNVGFYVETALIADRCWLYRDQEHVNLPPREQFPYDPVIGRGKYILSVESNYTDLGRKNILLGVDALDGYVSQLFTIKDGMRKYGRKLQKFKLDQPKIDELKKGAFTFGPVIISEPSRFQDYQDFMVANLCDRVHVPKEHTKYFTDWSSISVAFVREGPLEDGKGNVRLTMEEVSAKICLLCSSVVFRG